MIKDGMVIISRRGSGKMHAIQADSICLNCKARDICEDSDVKFKEKKGFLYIRIACKNDIWEKWHNKEVDV